MNLLKEYLARDEWRDWEAMLDRLPIESGQSVLDLGCGPGLVSARLASLCERVVGIDQESSFLEYARRHCPSNCEFVNADIGPVSGLWSSFAAAYFPTFAPVLERWTSCVAPGGWLAIVEVDDLLDGHHPLSEEARNAFKEFMDHARSNDRYDFRMGRRLGGICRRLGLNVISETSWEDPELAFDGAAPPEILAAWTHRFERMHTMRTYFGAERFHRIADAFMNTISSPEHTSTASVTMVLARRPE